MPATKETENLRSYVNDMLALEQEIASAITVQSADARVRSEPGIRCLLEDIAADSSARLGRLEDLTIQLDDQWGALVKEAVTAATGTLSGIYGMVRKHALSRMLRDDHVALNLTATAYGMLYTAALAYGNDEIAMVALEHLNALPPQIMKLAELIPDMVVKELAESDAAVNAHAAELANEAITAAWQGAATATEETSA